MREMTIRIFLNNIDLICTIEVNGTNYDNGFEIVSAYLSDSNINIVDLLDEVELSKAVCIKLKLSEL
jgi:hypothetical protein